MHTQQLESLESLTAWKRQYLEQATAPLDGMWLDGFVPQAAHFALIDGEVPVGFYCVNDEGYLLQFFVSAGHRARASEWFGALVRPGAASNAPQAAEEETSVRGAFASTAEPAYLSLCLDHYATYRVHTLMYQLEDSGAAGAPVSEQTSCPLRPVTQAEHTVAVEFAIVALGAPRDWLEGYYANLIERGELFGLWQANRLVATGESRRFDGYQAGCADLGVVVAQSERRRGLATQVLGELVRRNTSDGLRSMCSTEAQNHAAQKAITRAGFVAPHRILQFDA